ncbi:cytochrome c biogenesis protein CcdA [Pacificibacter maritimus]|uniref:Cytochrome c biogenesis protein CcdA n=1 Tax=Pacificibacter maritimus TaxID=762213 RepID=A0A3N4VDR0_9RHOB|nr:cytochrome c biogenesis CcdA family protein [Pacificibacter maritimus]RPE71074.1 cytochrome c biogenesis protein CcdA [Pacificibacter maritimus]
MEYLFAYGAGLLTLINPCVLPILPIVLASAMQSGRGGPLYMAVGMSVSFVVFGMFVTTFGFAIGLDEQRLGQIGAVMMLVFGVILLVPALSERFSSLTARFANSADAQIDQLQRGSVAGQVGTGALLGIVWSPCIGPTLGGAIALASQGESLGRAALIMTAFALGVSTLILGLGYGARSWVSQNQKLMQAIAAKSRPILGAVFCVVGLGLLLKIHHVIEIWAIQNLPAWLIDLSVSL